MSPSSQETDSRRKNATITAITGPGKLYDAGICRLAGPGSGQDLIIEIVVGVDIFILIVVSENRFINRFDIIA